MLLISFNFVEKILPDDENIYLFPAVPADRIAFCSKTITLRAGF
jgi:hypothetical protein